MSQQNNQPIKKFRCSNISAAVFENEIEKDNEKITRFSVQIQKQFRRDDGSWQVTNVFFPEELNKLQLLAAKSYEFIALQESQDMDDSVPV
jgi:hypothetical protein